MTNSILEEIERGWQLLNEGKEEEVLQLVTVIEKKDDLKPEENLRCQILKGTVVCVLGEFEKALRIVKRTYQESLKLEKPLLSIDVIFIKVVALTYLGRYYESWEDITHGEKLLKSTLQEPFSEIDQGEAILSYLKGWLYYSEQNFDLAIECLKRSLAIFERHSRLFFVISYNLSFLGFSYVEKGELELALKSLKKSLELSKGNNVVNRMKNILSNIFIGQIYYQQGDLDLAVEYYVKNLKILEQYKPYQAKLLVGSIFDNLIKVFLDKQSPEQAQEYLNRFQKHIEKNNLPKDFYLYRLSKARILKSSSRTRNRAEAEKILKELIEGHDTTKITIIRGLPEELIEAIIELCDYYLGELHSTNDLEILEDIQPIITRLLKESERTNSFVVQASTKLLQGQLALLEMNMGDARKYISQAQQIAETHGLHLLARKVSYEHDKLLEQLDNLETFKKKKIPISDRMDLVSLEETVDLILKKRMLKPPELIDEVPVLLLIITEGGIPAFSNPFSEELSDNDGFISNFLRGFNTFSEEVFSRGLNRAAFGEYKLIMESIDSFSVCYLFKGQTYVAKQKLSRFAERVYNIAPIWQVFRDFHETHQAILLSENPSLKSLLEEIFIKKSAEISTLI